ncbi:MAG: helix-turn-helix transcriptional regulator [Planctomycetes bacterium]|nr:helix-turn-helix transcriptional regulator [Planctomycetota bacterium]
MPDQPTVPSGLLRIRQTVRSLGAPGDVMSCGFWNEEQPGDVVDAAYPSYVAVWILRGGVILKDWTGTTHRLGAGDLFQRPPGRRHTSLVQPGPYGECWLEIGGSFAELVSRLGVIDLDRAVLRPGVDLALVRRVDQFHQSLGACAEHELPRYAVELQAILAELYAMDRTGVAADPHAALIDDACRVLRDESGGRAALDRLCRQHGLGFERFRKLFTARMRCAPAAYRNRCRLDRARELLLAGDLPVKDIADRLGWTSVPSFSLAFKAAVGLSPAHYRARRRGASG